MKLVSATGSKDTQAVSFFWYGGPPNRAVLLNYQHDVPLSSGYTRSMGREWFSSMKVKRG